MVSDVVSEEHSWSRQGSVPTAGTAAGAGGRPLRAEHQIVDALNAEWSELDFDHRGVVAGWVGTHDELAGCGSFGAVLAAVEWAPDAVRAALLTEVRRGDRLAARVVLQSMLGRLVGMARRDSGADVSDYVAEMWCQIWCYPLERRPQRIAANLALDTLKAVRHQTRWLRRGEVRPWPPYGHLNEVVDDQALAERLDHNRAGRLTGEAVLRVACELSVVDEATAGLLRSVYLEGLSGAVTAHRLGVSAGSVRTRCSRALSRLAAEAPRLSLAA